MATTAQKSLKPIVLYSMARGTNPPKVNFILEELSIPYTTKWISFAEVKEPSFTAINPNGRVPAIVDPNTNLTVWESGAIIEYLITTYDTTHALSFTAPAEYWAAKQWLAFQISGQGPYWGQAVWFTHYHSEKLPSARMRYVAEVERVIGVLDAWLKKDDKEYLVGGRCSFADLSFIPWCKKVPEIDLEGKIDVEGKYPAYHQWLTRLEARPVVKKVLEDMVREAAQGH